MKIAFVAYWKNVLVISEIDFIDKTFVLFH